MGRCGLDCCRPVALQLLSPAKPRGDQGADKRAWLKSCEGQSSSSRGTGSGRGSGQNPIEDFVVRGRLPNRRLVETTLIWPAGLQHNFEQASRCPTQPSGFPDTAVSSSSDR